MANLALHQKKLTMNRILFPTDYSFNADKAFEHALEIAAATKAELVLMHAFQLDHIHPDLTPESYDMRHDETKGKLQQLIDIARQEPKYADVRFNSASLIGTSVDTILEAVKLYEPDLLVMGTRGQTGLPAIFSPSVSRAVLKAVSIPVMLVPDTADIANFRNFAFAADYSAVDSGALDSMKTLAMHLKAQITIVHIGEDAADLTIQESAEAINLSRFLGEGVKHDYRFIQSGDVVESLEDYMTDRADLGLLIMVNHERNDWLERILLPSHTNQIVKNAQVPVLVLKD
jgi:nucleotide-binding universal stress UspA family protein